jgi:rhodanese-related sulfurtransferase
MLIKRMEARVMKRSGVLLTMVVLLLVGVAAPSRSQTVDVRKVPVEGGASYTNVSASGLARLLEKKDFPLINVHIPYEGEIEATDLFIPFDQVEANLTELPADRHAKVVLYCRSGSMSVTAARALVRLGYTDVWNLDGGMIAWRAAGYPLLQKAR